MTQEQKDILIKDLCSRLPYGVKVEYENKAFDLEYVCSIYEEVKLDIPETWTIDVSEVKPYLFPLSSMTEEQKREYHELVGGFFGASVLISVEDLTDFFNKNHIDYRGLISIDLAIDATNLNIY